MKCMSDCATILPGSWLGVFGGGQLGRMFTHQPSVLVIMLVCGNLKQIVRRGKLLNSHFQPSGPDEERVAAIELSKLCNAITIEFENINARHLHAAAHHALAFVQGQNSWRSAKTACWRSQVYRMRDFQRLLFVPVRVAG